MAKRCAPVRACGTPAAPLLCPQQRALRCVAVVHPQPLFMGTLDLPPCCQHPPHRPTRRSPTSTKSCSMGTTSLCWCPAAGRSSSSRRPERGCVLRSSDPSTPPRTAPFIIVTHCACRGLGGLWSGYSRREGAPPPPQRGRSWAPSGGTGRGAASSDVSGGSIQAVKSAGMYRSGWGVGRGLL